ncbi:MAG TPA: hypothetical protein VIZ87_10470 [Terrimicrobium sp.]
MVVIVERLSLIRHRALETQIPAERLAIKIRLRSLNDRDLRVGKKSNRPDEYSGHRDEVGVQLQNEGGSCMTQSVVLITRLPAAIVRACDVADAFLIAALFKPVPSRIIQDPKILVRIVDVLRSFDLLEDLPIFAIGGDHDVDPGKSGRVRRTQLRFHAIGLRGTVRLAALDQEINTMVNTIDRLQDK